MIPELVIFDCDGVLIDSEIIACEIEARALSAEGYCVSAADVAERFLGRPASEVLRVVEDSLSRPLPPSFMPALEAEIVAAYRDRLRAVPGAADAVTRLGAARCVASSSAPAKLFAGLVETDLIDLFYPHIFSTVLVENGKPAPDLFLLAAERCGVAPAAAVVVEDSPSGVAAGRAAGMAVVGFTGGAHCPPRHAECLRAHGAETIATGFHELAEAVASLAVAAKREPAS